MMAGSSGVGSGRWIKKGTAVSREDLTGCKGWSQADLNLHQRLPRTGLLITGQLVSLWPQFPHLKI